MQHSGRQIAILFLTLLALGAVFGACGEQIAPDGQPGSSAGRAAATPTGALSGNAHRSPTPVATTSPPSEASALAGTVWVLTALDSERPFRESGITLRFGRPDLGGKSGCNIYSGRFTAGEGAFRVDPIVSTAMACSPRRVMDREAAYLAALRAASTYRVILRVISHNRLEERNTTMTVTGRIDPASHRGPTRPQRRITPDTAPQRT